MNAIFSQETAITFVLVLSRIGGVIIASPIFSSRSIPRKIKVILALVIALMVFPALPTVKNFPLQTAYMIYEIFSQLALGLLVGFAVTLLFAGLQAAGSIIDFVMGFSMSTVVDPSFNMNASVVSRMYYFLALILFLIMGGHHWIILGLINSFKIIPIQATPITPGLIDYIIRAFSDILLIAFNCAAPILIAIILVDVTAGFIARTAPKLNILFITFPFKIALGMFLLTALLPTTLFVFGRWLSDLKSPLIRFFYI
ncbi:MAG: flagellar biosynthetic protein FliR [Vulcanimicrobiota bacterium]